MSLPWVKGSDWVKAATEVGACRQRDLFNMVLALRGSAQRLYRVGSRGCLSSSISALLLAVGAASFLEASSKLSPAEYSSDLNNFTQHLHRSITPIYQISLPRELPKPNGELLKPNGELPKPNGELALTRSDLVATPSECILTSFALLDDEGVVISNGRAISLINYKGEVISSLKAFPARLIHVAVPPKSLISSLEEALSPPLLSLPSSVLLDSNHTDHHLPSKEVPYAARLLITASCDVPTSSMHSGQDAARDLNSSLYSTLSRPSYSPLQNSLLKAAPARLELFLITSSRRAKMLKRVKLHPLKAGQLMPHGLSESPQRGDLDKICALASYRSRGKEGREHLYLFVARSKKKSRYARVQHTCQLDQYEIIFDLDAASSDQLEELSYSLKPIRSLDSEHIDTAVSQLRVDEDQGYLYLYDEKGGLTQYDADWEDSSKPIKIYSHWSELGRIDSLSRGVPMFTLTGAKGGDKSLFTHAASTVSLDASHREEIGKHATSGAAIHPSEYASVEGDNPTPADFDQLLSAGSFIYLGTLSITPEMSERAWTQLLTRLDSSGSCTRYHLGIDCQGYITTYQEGSRRPLSRAKLLKHSTGISLRSHPLASATGRMVAFFNERSCALKIYSLTDLLGVKQLIRAGDMVQKQTHRGRLGYSNQYFEEGLISHLDNSSGENDLGENDLREKKLASEYSWEDSSNSDRNIQNAKGSLRSGFKGSESLESSSQRRVGHGNELEARGVNLRTPRIEKRKFQPKALSLLDLH